VDDALPTLIYDGDCGFCTSSANWVSRRWTGKSAPAAVPWQHLPDGRAAELHLTVDDFARSAWWIDGDRVEGGSRAVAYALRATDGPWTVAGRLLLVPPVSWVAPSVYRLVARYRHRLPGGSPACTS
jgi:predicted DCC family thiol-disulfide oxidoreductase YuxK